MSEFVYEDKTGSSEFQETVANAVVGNPLFPGKGFNGECTVALHPLAGSGKIQYTVSPRAAVEADPAGAGVYWLDWEDGDVIAGTIATLIGNITALRAVSVAGDCVLEARYK